MMDPNKRGNPPFEPSSFAAGLERRVKRCERWSSRAREAARWLLDGSDHQKTFATQWWREQLDQPEVVLSAQGMEARQGGDANAAPSRSDDSPVSREADAPQSPRQNISDVLIEALGKIANGTEDVEPPFRSLPSSVMQSIARDALRQAKGEAQ